MVLSAALATAAAAGGCDGEGSAVKEPIIPRDAGTSPPLDGSTTDAPVTPDGSPSDCVTNPKTHDEIINACTDAVKITKEPMLPLLYPDGGLPPLP